VKAAAARVAVGLVNVEAFGACPVKDGVAGADGDAEVAPRSAVRFKEGL
jgi:hypothetical protein